MQGTETRFTRRHFLSATTALVAGSALAACGAPAAPTALSILPTAPAANPAPVVLRTSKAVRPGEVFGIYGESFDPQQTTVRALPLSGHPGDLAVAAGQPLQLINVQPNLIQAMLPADAPADLYALWVQTPGGIAGPVFVNRAEAWWLSEREVYPGQTVRLIGRNFIPPRLRTAPERWRQVVQVELTDLASAESVRVTDVLAVTEYTIDFRIPHAVRVGRRYQLRVSNGAGGEHGWSAGLADAEPVMVAERPGGNPLDLEKSWARQILWDRRLNVKAFGARGDGQADDTAAIQQALEQAASSGGGVVFLPAGTYRIAGLTLRSRTILLGAGKEETTLVYNGTRSPDDQPVPPGRTFAYANSIPFIQGEGVSLGLARLSLVNEVLRPQDDGYSRYRRLSGWVVLVWLKGDQGVVIKEVGAHNVDGAGIWVEGDRDILVEGCDIEVTHGGIWVTAREGYCQIRNNRVSSVARPMMAASNYGIIEGNHLHGDPWFSSYRYPPEPPYGAGEYRLMELTSRDIYVAGNRADGEVGDFLNNGEGINFQKQTRLVYSKATGGDATSLIDSSQSFQPDALKGASIVIIGGTGIGQLRGIASNSATRIVVDSPWEIVPDSSSVYAVDRYVNYHHLIVGNDLEASLRGGAVMLYTKNYDNIIAGNTFRNSGGIWRAEITVARQNRADISYYLDVVDNQITGGADPRTIDQANYLMVGWPHTQPTEDPLRGTLVYANEYRRNVMLGRSPELAPLAVGSSSNLGFVCAHSGISTSSLLDSPTSYPVAQGTIVGGNVVHQVRAGLYLPNTAFDTVLHDNDFSGNGIEIDQRGSLRTVALAAGRLLPAIPYQFQGAWTDQGVRLSWSSLHATGYRLERAEGLNGAFQILADGLTESEYLDRTAALGRVYSYRVTARNQGGDSLPQAIVVYPAQPVPARIVLSGVYPIPPSVAAMYSVQIFRGQTRPVQAQVRDQFDRAVPGAVVEWMSEDPSVATVDGSGRIAGRSDGVALIKARYRDLTATLITLVSAPTQVLLVPRQADVVIPAGHRAYFRIVGLVSDGTATPLVIPNQWPSVVPSVTFVTSNPSVAQVIATSLIYPYVQGLAPGTATITAAVTLQGTTVSSRPLAVTVVAS